MLLLMLAANFGIDVIFYEDWMPDGVKYDEPQQDAAANEVIDYDGEGKADEEHMKARKKVGRMVGLGVFEHCLAIIGTRMMSVDYKRTIAGALSDFRKLPLLK